MTCRNQFISVFKIKFCDKRWIKINWIQILVNIKKNKFAMILLSMEKHCCNNVDSIFSTKDSVRISSLRNLRP